MTRSRRGGGRPCRWGGGARTCDHAAFDEASCWIARLASASADEQRAFAAWLEESDCHKCAWARVQDLWRLAGLALADEPSTE